MRNWITNRELMKSHFDATDFLDEESDQVQGINPPPVESRILPDAVEIALPRYDSVKTVKPDLADCILHRMSRRKYTTESITLEELSFMLWATQGVKKTIDAYNNRGTVTYRTVPSAGARHPFETYLAVNNVTGVKPGIYRYSALKHSLIFLFQVNNVEEKLTAATVGQSFTGDAPVVFFWACRPYMGEWRYKGESHKAMLLDAGHVCQNLYLAAESLQLGTVAIAAYSQSKVDALLKLDGKDEFVVYLAPVGRVKETE
ncbi:MAG: SagB/ThcOx family dehydrogenase [Candidatus Fermentibacteraceae bacterium]|nr:SagB/ThcOx family dehydrogenase [Candidatus Fermentibacteraceae bacterium]